MWGTIPTARVSSNTHQSNLFALKSSGGAVLISNLPSPSFGHDTTTFVRVNPSPRGSSSTPSSIFISRRDPRCERNWLKWCETTRTARAKELSWLEKRRKPRRGSEEDGRRSVLVMRVLPRNYRPPSGAPLNPLPVFAVDVEWGAAWSPRDVGMHGFRPRVWGGRAAAALLHTPSHFWALRGRDAPAPTYSPVAGSVRSLPRAN